MRDGFRLVIAGAPNVGKSSLLNVLAEREAAIVTSEPGTTRDVIEVHMTIGGFPVLMMDTAGFRKTEGAIEKEGMKRAVNRLNDADLILWLVDPSCTEQESTQDTSILSSLHKDESETTVWRILSKADLTENNNQNRAEDIEMAISSHSKEGISELISKIEKLLQGDVAQHAAPLITRARHRTEVLKAQNALLSFMDGSLADAELRAEDLRQAATALGRLTGRIDVEELLGHIFGEFCIGK